MSAGIAWLMLGNRSGGGAKEHRIDADSWRHEHRYRSLEEARWSTARREGESDAEYEERVHGAYAKALNMRRYADEAMDDFKTRVGNAAASAKEAASHLRARLADSGEAMVEGARHMRHRAADMYEDNPLAAGAIAVAIGALIGGAAPLTDVERQSLGGVADAASRAMSKARDTLAERGARAAEKAADALH
jgi:ElaB/YqjD/DUF883 family membrane-anchored ribosome-binding protein